MPVRPGWAVAAAHLASGLVLVAQPERVISTLARPGALPPTWVVRVLGARSAVQGALTALVPTRRVILAGAAVDASHAVTMVPLVWASGRHRRAAGTSAAVAVAMAALGVISARALR